MSILKVVRGWPVRHVIGCYSIVIINRSSNNNNATRGIPSVSVLRGVFSTVISCDYDGKRTVLLAQIIKYSRYLTITATSIWAVFGITMGGNFADFVLDCHVFQKEPLLYGMTISIQTTMCLIVLSRFVLVRFFFFFYFHTRDSPNSLVHFSIYIHTIRYHVKNHLLILT